MAFENPNEIPAAAQINERSPQTEVKMSFINYDGVNKVGKLIDLGFDIEYAPEKGDTTITAKLPDGWYIKKEGQYTDFFDEKGRSQVLQFDDGSKSYIDFAS